MIDLSPFQIRKKIEITFKYFIPRKNQFEICADREDFFSFCMYLGKRPKLTLDNFQVFQKTVREY